MIAENQPNQKGQVKIGITHGDINGICYEVIMKSLHDKRILELFTPVVYGIPKAASYHRKTISAQDFNFHIARDISQIRNNKPNLISIHDQEVKIELGNSTEKAGQMAFTSLEAATGAISKNEIDVIVTAPINKKNIQSQAFNFPGHTEYLAEKFNARDYLMLMVSDEIRIGAITGHIPIKEVSARLTKEMIEGKIKILHDSLVKDFAIRRPKIAVLSLNPHAGDKGLLGAEEKEIIKPAIDGLFNNDLLVYGPYPADGFFGSGEYRNFDAILAMYHDQAMMPFKILSFDKGVNFTAGLPIVRTSPAHGTAYDIAGKNQASPESFRNAMYLAVSIFNNRKMHDEISKNPLKEAKPNGNKDDIDAKELENGTDAGENQ